MGRLDQYERVQVESRAEWRAWLAANHGRTESIWLVTFKKGSGRGTVPYDDVVEEALAFGWVDSLPRSLDEQRTMLLLSPRRSGSNWSRINKERVARLLAAGLMHPAGLAKVEAAKADGTWTALDEVETLAIPADLAQALAAAPPAAERFAAFSSSSRRGILEWLSNARTQATRQK
ncbi:YdeI/OmpD-associated family protein, partial [Nostoc sp. NIES-2111]